MTEDIFSMIKNILDIGHNLRQLLEINPFIPSIHEKYKEYMLMITTPEFIELCKNITKEFEDLNY